MREDLLTCPFEASHGLRFAGAVADRSTSVNGTLLTRYNLSIIKHNASTIALGSHQQGFRLKACMLQAVVAEIYHKSINDRAWPCTNRFMSR